MQEDSDSHETDQIAEINRLVTDKKRLNKHCTYASLLLDGCARNSYRVERAVTGEDVVEEVIVDIYEGKRRWNREKYPDFDKYVADSIKSEVYAARKKAARERERVYADEGPGEVRTPLDGAASSDDPAEATVVKCDIEGIQRWLCDNTELSHVFEDLIKGMNDKEIAEDLGIQVKGVCCLKRRLLRRLRKALGGKIR